MIMGRRLVNRLLAQFAALAALALAGAAQAEDGYKLWLRYAPLEGKTLARLRAFNPRVKLPPARPAARPTLAAAAQELGAGLNGLLAGGGRPAGTGPGNVALDCERPTGGDGRFEVEASRHAIRISGPSDLSCLYGAFALLRELALGHDPATIDLKQRPAMPLRMIDHWDDPNGYVLRGYSGRSIFDWWKLPGHLDRRLIDYARAEASIGINGAVVNSVNASPLFLTDRYIPKLRRVADAWRPYAGTCLELFGADRCMVESNFPVEKMGIGYAGLWNALKRIVAGASADEKRAIFSGTANRVYRLGLAD